MKDRESLGVYVFELKFKTSDTKKPTLEFLKASDLLKAEKGKAFSKLIAESYMITDWICKDYPLHCDHVSAWSKGGATTEENYQMLCRTHNRAKGNR